MSAFPLVDYSDDDEEEDAPKPVAPLPTALRPVAAVQRASHSPAPGPLTPSRDGSATTGGVKGLVKLRNSEGSRVNTPTFESAVTPSAASELSPSRDSKSPGPEPVGSTEDHHVELPTIVGDGSRRNEILRPKNYSDIQLPPEPEGTVDEQLQVSFGLDRVRLISHFLTITLSLSKPSSQAKMEKWTELRANGTIFNRALMNNKGFRNPSIMNKLIEFLDLDQYGTNYAPEDYDPRSFPPESYLEELLKAQGRRSATGQANAATGATNPTTGTRQIAFDSSTMDRLRGIAAAAAQDKAAEQPPRKKSKWDSAPPG